MASLKNVRVALGVGLPLYSHLSVGAQSGAVKEQYGFVDYQWGIPVTATLVAKPFLPGKSQLSSKDRRAFFKGREIWRWSVDDLVPRSYPAEVRLEVNERNYLVPVELLRDLWMPNDDVKAWLAKDRKVCDLRFSCGDGGVGTVVFFHFDFQKRKVERSVYKDNTLVDTARAKLR